MPDSRPRRVHPQRALLHPVWLGALVVLALNDHVLKGSTLVPDVVAGKLSDIAGMLVAPALLATALQIRTMRGWWLSHVAVGVVFATIKLSVIAATGWSALMGAFEGLLRDQLLAERADYPARYGAAELRAVFRAVLECFLVKP